MAGESIRRIVSKGCFCALLIAIVAPTSVRGQQPRAVSRDVSEDSGDSSTELKNDALRRLPLKRLTPAAQQRIMDIADSPTIYRRLPAQAIDCDQDMFLFLTRNPEVMVGIWDLMGITNVDIRRTGPYQLEARDGSGTTCLIDLVYGDPNVHIYVATGSYDGKMVARPIRGSGVFMVTSRYAHGADGRTTVTGTIDCFLQMDSLGADLVARTLSGLIGRSADNNFIETARFMAQVSHASQRNPASMLDVAGRIPQVNDATRANFSKVIQDVAIRAQDRYATLPGR
ncbi:hypothetical protein [Rubripirellula amarantea]|uniref:hypothetical protein n=1 Tax=Rubripirellula amarantea TaxID=2527999 RepID=UPI0011B60424|nr:hypothetical protein [Rubripirellula amarantea]